MVKEHAFLICLNNKIEVKHYKYIITDGYKNYEMLDS